MYVHVKFLYSPKILPKFSCLYLYYFIMRVFKITRSLIVNYSILVWKKLKKSVKIIYYYKKYYYYYVNLFSLFNNLFLTNSVILLNCLQVKHLILHIVHSCLLSFQGPSTLLLFQGFICLFRIGKFNIKIVFLIRRVNAYRMRIG